MNSPRVRTGAFLLLSLSALWHLCQPDGLVHAQALSRGHEVEAFFTAIQMNDTNAATALLESNTNLALAREDFSKLPLLEAAAAGNVALVKRLLQLGADINAAGDTRSSGGSQKTALHEAIRHNRPRVCELLLESGANPSVMAFGFTTPLHLACSENHEEMAGWLLDYGAEPFQGKLFANDDTTPFELAITRSDGRLVPRMLGQEPRHPLGAKSLQKPARAKPPHRGVMTAAEVLAKRGSELLTAAAVRGELEAVQALLNAGVSATNASAGCPTLLQAFALAASEAARTRQSVMDQWQQAQASLGADYIPRADPDFVASLRWQESELAAKVGRLAPERWQAILRALVRHGADYDAFAATALGDTNQLIRLVSAGKHVARGRDCKGQTPLFWAMQPDRLPLVGFWIQAGTPLSATNSAGQTALHLAAAKGLTDHVRSLLAAKAPTDIADTNGWRPLEAAIQAKHQDSIHLLLADQSTPPHPERGLATTLHEAAASGNVAALAALLEATTNLEVRNELGLTPLQIAVERGHLAAAALLVDKGAKVNVQDPDGNTLLHQTIPRFFGFYVKDRPPVSWLNRMGNDPRKATYEKYLTVGQYEQGPHGIMQTVCFLLAAGIDVKATNHAGLTAIQLAADEKTTLFDDREPLLKLLGGAGGSFDAADAEGNTPLHRLAHGFFSIEAQDSIAGLIASGANVNAKNKQGRTPLHETVQPDYIWQNWMEMLLKAHADPNAQDTNGFTPLHLLATTKAHYGQGEAARALLAAGAKPDLFDHQGRTPLILARSSPASSWEMDAFTQALLAAGAHADGKDAQGRTAVHLALMGPWPWRSAGGIAALAKAGADLSAKDDEGKTPLHYLAALGSQHPMFFIRGIGDVFSATNVNVNLRDNQGDTPLHLAAKTGTSDVFDWLVAKGANLDATNNAGETPRLLAARNQDPFGRARFPTAEVNLFQAVRDGKLDSATRLLNADAELVNATNRSGQTPLRLAVTLRQTNLVDFLEKRGAHWDAASAVMAGRADILRTILQRNPAAVSNIVNGRGLLHLAAANGDWENVQLLLAARGDPVAADSWGLSPLGYALINRRTNIAQLLVANGASENLFDAVYLGDLKTAAQLVAHDRSLGNSRNSARVSVVEVAAAAGKADILRLLLKPGAAPTMSNSPKHGVAMDTRPPLHLAAFHNQTNAMELLIKAGAQVNEVDSRGFTPLHWAAINDAAGAATLLLKNKADLNAPVAETATSETAPFGRGPRGRQSLAGDTPLHLAALIGRTNMISMLLQAGAEVNAANAASQTPLDLSKSIREFPTIPFLLGQRTMWDLLEPLGISRPAPRMVTNLSAVAKLLEKAGGKHSSNSGFLGPPRF